MGIDFGVSIAIGLFIYVLVTIMFGTVNWAFHLVPDDAIFVLGGFLGIVAILISIAKNK